MSYGGQERVEWVPEEPARNPSPGSQPAGPAEQAKQLASTGAEQARDVASTGAEQAKEVATATGDAANQVLASAGEQVTQVTHDIRSQAQTVLSEAQTQVRAQADTQTGQVADGLKTFSAQVRALADGRPDEAGVARDYASQVAGKVEAAADRLRERGVDGVVEDLSALARRRPGSFLLGAAALGFGVGRLLKGNTPASSGDGRRDQALAQPTTAQFVGSPSALPAAEYPSEPLHRMAAPELAGSGMLAGGTSEPAHRASMYRDDQP